MKAAALPSNAYYFYFYCFARFPVLANAAITTDAITSNTIMINTAHWQAHIDEAIFMIPVPVTARFRMATGNPIFPASPRTLITDQNSSNA